MTDTKVLAVYPKLIEDQSDHASLGEEVMHWIEKGHPVLIYQAEDIHYTHPESHGSKEETSGDRLSCYHLGSLIDLLPKRIIGSEECDKEINNK